MAENITGMESVTWGGISHTILPCSSRFMERGVRPSDTRVSMGSRKGSMGRLVTCEALTRSLPQYTGCVAGEPMEERSTPPVAACLHVSSINEDGQLAPPARRPSGAR